MTSRFLQPSLQIQPVLIQKGPRVLSLLCAHGVFYRVDGRFQHSELSRIIRSHHPASMRAFARMFGIPLIWQSVIRLNDSVATGRPMGNDVTEGGFWRYFEDHPEDNDKFNSSMAAKSQVVIPLVVAAYDFESLFNRRCGRWSRAPPGRHYQNPHQAHWRSLRPTARCARSSVNLGDRLQVLGGDFFTDTLPEADAYVLMEVIHDWDDGHAERILRTVRNAAPGGSKILLVEAMMPEVPEPCWTTTTSATSSMLRSAGGRATHPLGHIRPARECGSHEVREIPVGAGHSIVHATFA